MIAWFPAPSSFTGEEVVELHVHGGHAVVKGVMQSLSSFPSTRLAERGEFTRRAFERGKLDLLQVEGIADIVAADTPSQLQQALMQAGGEVSIKFDSWRKQIVHLLAHVEATIDFGDDEEDVDDIEIYTSMINKMDSLRQEIIHVLEDRRGKTIRDGIRVAIVGPPNAGKSTMLNLLAARDAAIVSNVPGTTRDVIEIQMNINGYNILLNDTAGMNRNTENQLEHLGMLKTKEVMEEADVIMCMFDSKSTDLKEDLCEMSDLIQAVSKQNVIAANNDNHYMYSTTGNNASVPPLTVVVANKSDAIAEEEHTGLLPQLLPTYFNKNVKKNDYYYVSCLTNDGIDELIESLGKHLEDRYNLNELAAEPSFVTRSRHRKHLIECVHMLSDALDMLRRDSDTLSIELVAEHLRLASASIGRIGGKIDPEDVLDAIFNEFCIGK
jgi:tRNA modification GTPase